MIGRDAFQETDVIGITLPITKHSVLVEDISELAGQGARGLRTSRPRAGPGPVLIDMPKDVQNQKMEWDGRGAAAGPTRPWIADRRAAELPARRSRCRGPAHRRRPAPAAHGRVTG